MIETVEVIVRQPGEPDRVVTLSEGATRIGRAEDNELVLADVGVSRRHAQIFISRGEVTIEDLGSGNGTYYNGYRIQTQPLQDGDEIVIDPFVLQFRISGQEKALRVTDPPESAPARLEVVVGTGMAGSSYPITSRGLSIGRSEDRDVVIPDPAASRHHCSVLLQGEDYVLKDMGSANGVYVNAVRVRDCTLSDGDLIRIGNTEMRFVRSEQSVGDITAQVVPNDVWNSGTGDPVFTSGAPQTILPREAETSGSSRMTGLIGLVVGLLLAFFAVAALGLLAVTVILVMIAADTPLPDIPPRPPAWHLDLPGGLESAPANELFGTGVTRLSEGDYRGALEDFYRVLDADPGHRSADRFAFAAGERLVLDTMQRHLEQQIAAQKAREAERSKLLRDSRRSGRVRRNAQAALEERFREDPVVIEAMGWKPTERLVALERKTEEAAELLDKLSYAEAAARYQEVLDGSRDPALRKTAAAGLKVSQREIARGHAETWRRAVLAEATGSPDDARPLFQELASADPANVSARLRLERLP